MKVHRAVGMQGEERFIVGESKNIAHKPRWGRMMQVKGNDALIFFGGSLKLDLENCKEIMKYFSFDNLGLFRLNVQNLEKTASIFFSHLWDVDCQV